MSDPRGRALTIAMSDQVFRSARPARVASQLTYLIGKYGIPHYLSASERIAMWLASVVGPYLPDIVIPAVIDRLRRKTRAVILAGEEHALRAHLKLRHDQGIRLNLNQLGEAILGEEEARIRLESYIKLLERPDVDYISVKISSVLSQINLLDYDNSVEAIRDRLRILYRTAMQSMPAFVNLDMEEYRDLHLTIAAFRRTLEEPEFKSFHAGIVLQAYLPDAHQHQRELTAWAIGRIASGGAPIKIRIVKGANLAMERVDASLHGWNEATFHSKAEVDANYKRMVVWALKPEHARAVHSGIASHNLFDIAWAILLRARNHVEPYAEIEMLEGMANPQARAVKNVAGSVLLYAPVVKREDFRSAISYLLRRLDENAADGNFLHDLFGLVPGDRRWQSQKEAFLTAVRERNSVSSAPQRKQDRNTEQRRFDPDQPFRNEPDTDWSLPHNQAWIYPYVNRWKNASIDPLPLQIDGSLSTPNFNGTGADPNTPGREPYRFALATPLEIDLALTAAVAARHEWASTTTAHRSRLLSRAAEILAERRGDLIGVMMRDTAKSVTEGDVEVSEAVDYANYYARAFASIPDNDHEPLGTVLVTPPWNFPLAIPASGVIAALMAGNTVILKPAPESVLTGWHLCTALWDAGIPGRVLQFLPTSDDSVGQSLVTDPRISAVILTGGYDTARLFKHWKPELHLLAETSGKNSIIITALSDRDQAIKDLIRSAFGHSGQKCSAASLAVLEAEVYDSPAFLNRLRDATASLAVGEAWNLASVVTPVIREPGETLLRALTQLDDGEQWLLEPHIVNGNPQLWSPGIKLGVKRGSWYHRTECFGPVLGLMRAENFTDAIDIVNDSEFGLTSGLHTLDDREIALWREKIEAGNTYINRGITGAIVQRQPFGGWKKSAFGAAKAGGPNYVINLCHWRRTGTNNTYEAAWRDYFSREHDPSQILGESNSFRYRPIRNVLIRIAPEDNPNDGVQALEAAKVCGVPAMLSEEDDAAFIERIASFERIRAFRPLSRQAYERASAAHTLVIETPFSLSGRIELRHYLREQSVTHTTHRYGALLCTHAQF